MSETLGVCIVSADPALIADLAQALEHFHAPGCIVDAPDDDPHARVLHQIQQQIQHFWAQDSSSDCPLLTLLSYPSLEAAQAQLPIHAQQVSVEWLLLDSDLSADRLRAELTALLKAVQCNVRQPLRLTPASLIAYLPAHRQAQLAGYQQGNLQIRLHGAPRAARQADLLRLLMEHLEHAHSNRFMARSLQEYAPVRMATAIDQHMRVRWGTQWDVHYYTGSMVAALIDSLQQQLAGSPVRCLGGCNEHALAVAALSGWQLFGRAYVIVVTSGMLDEFRGTLANLTQAGAPGLIICAESPAASWFAFQGTLNADQDGHAVIAARGLDSVFIDKPDAMAGQLGQAFARLDARPRPTFVFATQAVLEARGEAAIPAPPLARPAALPPSPDLARALDQVMNLINHQPAPLLWQCGSLDDASRRLVYAIAEQAGIALVDSLSHPGSVAAYHQGRPVPQYLGTLAMYGFGRRVYAYLHPELYASTSPPPWLFFLKSRLDQAATPFSEGRLKRQLQIVQVNREARHMSPFTDIALLMPVEAFLRHVLAHLAVEPAVLQLRQARLAAVRELEETVPVDEIATLPMSSNYFFCQLGRLVDTLIREKGFRYLGVYDVGRGGISAVRNLPRTGPGFSGWYGRALMGDALMTLPYLAATSDQPILAFVGDGARALTPTIEHRLLDALARNPHGRQISLTLFYLNNGVLSLIQTYLDKRYARNGQAQLSLPSSPLPMHACVQEDLQLTHQQLSGFDAECLSEALNARGRISIFETPISHNSDGDGLSLLSETLWSRHTRPSALNQGMSL